MEPKKELPLAVVTGAAVRLGRSIALELARHGYPVGVHYHNSEHAARETAEEIRSIGGTAILMSADLTDPQQIKALFGQIRSVSKRLGVWVNSAAVMLSGDLATMTVADWDGTLALNLRAPWLCAREAAACMGPQGGVIINITDVGARKTWTGYPAYTISKSALETLTRLLARQLAPAVRVNAVAPGLILPSENLTAEEWARLVKRLPLQSAGTPEAVAQAVITLIQNDYITGEILLVDGGYALI
ncbi:dehydrogenase [Longilinea arvoryzae]|uniref:Dehydrogenase n=1 Tax=Longilinea arvoryzae TaxID=360412 RepID=A0A0S7BBL4_9CHLR|nr:SDR family oxidoreductase [Longilinea arvoryzae]GAP15196.1 dehydrogenase [Longilinea arvoryzae]